MTKRLTSKVRWFSCNRPNRAHQRSICESYPWVEGNTLPLPVSINQEFMGLMGSILKGFFPWWYGFVWEQGTSKIPWFHILFPVRKDSRVQFGVCPHFQTYPYFPTTSNNWWFAFLIIIFPIENPKKISMSRLSTGITMSVSTQPQEWANLVEPIHYRSTTPMGEITVPTTETVCRLARWARWQQLGCVIAWRGKMWLYFKIFKGNMRFKDAWL